MNRLSLRDRARVINALLEGNGIRATARLNDCSPVTVLKLLEDVGTACAVYHDQAVRNVRVRRLQCDEIWCFVGAKAKNVSPEKKQEGWGDVWTWVGIDADTAIELAAETFLIVEDEVRFRHPLKRSAIYSAATGAERRRAHEVLAAVSGAAGDRERRAWHLSE